MVAVLLCQKAKASVSTRRCALEAEVESQQRPQTRAIFLVLLKFHPCRSVVEPTVFQLVSMTSKKLANNTPVTLGPHHPSETSAGLAVEVA